MIAPPLGSLSAEAFMASYWQKQPLLVRGAIDPATCPFDGSKVLDLAVRDDADARLIIAESWPPELLHGPFEPEELEDLPDRAWTVLVQEVDRLSAPVSELLARFRFLPNWRIDDVMASYAVPGGGVGAHIDQYDVFLINLHGRRRWEIGDRPIDDPAWRDDSEVAVLADFTPHQAWDLEPGDLLYLPPRFPHNGVALDPCVTLSVGFRAPSVADLLASFAGYAAAQGLEAHRLTDPGLRPTNDPGYLSEEARGALRELLRNVTSNQTVMDAWFGRFVTEPVRGRSGVPAARSWTPTRVRRRLMDGAVLRRTSIAQLAWYEDAEGVAFFSAGELIRMPAKAAPAARLLAGAARLDRESVEPLLNDPWGAELLLGLMNDGLLEPVG